MMKARREYFFQQRAYPQGFIPSGLRVRAVAELNRQLSEQAAQRARAKLEGAAAIGRRRVTPPESRPRRQGSGR